MYLGQRIKMCMNSIIYIRRGSSIVKKIYDIENDDLSLRKLFNLSANKHGKYFDNLRTNYAVRREFFNAISMIN